MSNYPPGSDTPSAPWNQPDNEECPRCDSADTVRLIWKCDETDDVWECDNCGHEWDIQIGRDPDDIRDQRRDDALTENWED